MKFILDTHVFLWFISGIPKLSESTRHAIEDMANERWISVASLWEMSIKASIGKLNISLPFPELVKQHVYQNAMGLLPIKPEHVETLRILPFHHKDPFDRLIISQSIVEEMTILSHDSIFDDYGIKRIE